MLSVATMFSLLALPAYAIVPGEDAYGGVSTFVRYNYDTDTYEYIQVPKESFSPGTTSYPFLIDDELASVSNEAELQGVIGPDDSSVPVYPNTAPYSGIVLIVLECDTDDDGIADYVNHGTGFMVSERVMLTALHCFNPDSENEDAPDYAVVSTKIYQGVSAEAIYDFEVGSMGYLDCLDDYDYDTLESIVYDPLFFTSGRDSNYDWCIATLQTGFDCYYFDVGVATTGLTNQTVHVAGYPVYPRFFMRKASGLAGFFNENGNVLSHYVDAISGQSGAPLYMETGTNRVCYGIHVGGVGGEEGSIIVDYNVARAITSDLFEMIQREKDNAREEST